MSPSGWIALPKKKTLVHKTYTTSCKHEYTINYKNIVALPDKEAIVPYKICSFDIEASSSHGDFPVPIKTYKRVASNCVDVFMRMKQTQTLNETQAKKLLKRCILTAFDMDKLENVDLVYTKTKPSKNHVNSRIELLLKTSIKDLTNAKEEDVGEYADVGKLLCLEEKFEKSRE